ncbi:MAG: hypothetical protein WA446_11770 [Steroidobacteraceae bacterium]
MTKTYSLYEAATGLFTGKRLHCDDEGLLAVRLPAGTLAMEGAFNHRSQRVDLATGAVLAYRPPGTVGRSRVGWRSQALASQGRRSRR